MYKERKKQRYIVSQSSRGRWRERNKRLKVERERERKMERKGELAIYREKELKTVKLEIAKGKNTYDERKKEKGLERR